MIVCYCLLRQVLMSNSAAEIFTTLLSGAKLYILLLKMESIIGQPLIDTLQKQHVNVAIIPPSILQQLPEAILLNLHTLIVAGETCPAHGRAMVKRSSFS